MGQGVHTGGGGQRRGHALHQHRVVNGHVGRAAPVHDGHLHLAAGVGDDAEARHFRRRAGGGVDGHIGRKAFVGFVHAFIVLNLAAVGNDEAHALAAVVRAAAAQGDQAVALFLAVHFRGFFHVAIRGVGHGFVVYGIGHARLIQNIRDLLQNAGRHNTLVGNDERFGPAQLLHAHGDFTGSADAHERCTGNKEGKHFRVVQHFAHY